VRDAAQLARMEMGIWALGFGGSLPLGSLLAGWLASFLGSFPTIMLSGIMLICIATVMFHLTRRWVDSREERLPDAAPEAA